MQFCQKHWDDLRAAIDARGLTKFVASSGEELAQKMSAGGFDPLMGAHNAICWNALNIGGLDVMGKCPVCVGVEHNPEWEKCIELAADDVLEEAKKLGLVETH